MFCNATADELNGLGGYPGYKMKAIRADPDIAGVGV